MIDDDTNTRMKKGVVAACAVSASRTKSPIAANTQNNAKPHTSSDHVRKDDAPRSSQEAEAHHDDPTTRMISEQHDLTQEVGDSAATDERGRAIGNARNRSMSPDFESSAKER